MICPSRKNWNIKIIPNKKDHRSISFQHLTGILKWTTAKITRNIKILTYFPINPCVKAGFPLIKKNSRTRKSPTNCLSISRLFIDQHHCVQEVLLVMSGSGKRHLFRIVVLIKSSALRSMSVLAQNNSNKAHSQLPVECDSTLLPCNMESASGKGAFTIQRTFIYLFVS